MQVSLDVTGPLERRVTVDIPEERIASEIESRLRGIAQRARIAGFRPGKAPLKVVQRQFGAQVRGEVLGEVLRSSFQDAVTGQKLRPAGEPTIEPIKAEPGQGMTYSATFEVYPDVALRPVEELKLERLVCEISEADIDRMVESLRTQNRDLVAVERPAANGDVVNIDFEGRVDGQPFEGGKAAGVDIELGAGRLMEGFEAGLVGSGTGATVQVRATFPANHTNPALAGKPAEFEVRVNKVMEPRLPELDDAFFAKFGITEGGLGRFREEVLRNMTRERDQAVGGRNKQTVLEALRGANPLQVPQALVRREAQQLLEQMRRNLGASGRSQDTMANLTPELFNQEAERRVAIGLLLGDIIVRNGLRPEPAQVRAAVERMASGFEEPAAVVKWYYEDRSRLADVEAAVVEDSAVEWVLARAQVTDVPIEFDALMNPRQTAPSAENA